MGDNDTEHKGWKSKLKRELEGSTPRVGEFTLTHPCMRGFKV